MAHPGGRPLKFKTPEDLQEKVNQFFDHCKKVDEQPIVEGLALYLETSKQTILNYEGRKDFAAIIEDAKLKIAHSVMSRAMSGKINPTIAIWVSKNHYDYADRQDIAHSGGIATANVSLTPEQNKAGIDAIMRYQTKHKED